MPAKTSPMETVRKLLALAEHPTTPPDEAEAAMRQAARMMARHQIDEALARMSMSEGERRKPVREDWTWASNYTEFGAHLRSMLSEIARVNRCAIHIGLGAPYPVTVVGMRDDVDWVQQLYTTCYLTFIGRVNPSWDRSRSVEANIYALKVAGHKWLDIWRQMAHHGYGVEQVPLVSYRNVTWGDREAARAAGVPCDAPIRDSRGIPADHHWLARAYRRHAKELGDTNILKTQRHGAYRRSFAEGFADEIQHRLWMMERDAREEAKTTGTGTELALADSWAEVQDAFYREFPDRHPDAVRERSVLRAQETDQLRRAEREARDLKLAMMTDKQRADFLEKEQRKIRRDRESNDKYWERQEYANRTESSGYHAGRSSAKDVALSRSRPVGDDSATKKIGVS